MLLPTKQDFDSRLQTKKTTQRLSSIVDEQRFATSVNSAVEERFQLITTALTEYVESLEESMRSVTMPEEKDAPNEQIKKAFAQLDADLTSVKTPNGDYNEVRSRRDDARQSLENFKFNHDLHELPVLAESEFWHWAVLMALLFAETIINSFSFGEVSTMGLVGGFGQAFLFTIVNLALAYLAGNFFKFKNHYDANLRVSGWAVFVFFLIIIFLYNCFVGHYREALGAPDFQVAIQNSGASFFDNPTGISDGGALLLVVLGFIIAIITFMKNYNYEDPYPGYSRVGRREQDARAELRFQRDEVLLPRMHGVYEEAIMSLRKVTGGYEEHVERYAMALSSKKEIDSRLQGAVRGFRLLLREMLLDLKNQLQRAPLRHTPPEIDVDGKCDQLKSINPITESDFTDEEDVLQRMRDKKNSFDRRINEETANLNADLKNDLNNLIASWEAEDDGAVEVA